MTLDALPLRRGASGDAVRDLQRRLAAAGFAADTEPGRFDDATEQAVRAFQAARRLATDGICGRDTWTALVEAGYRLGDRLLYLRSPMVRGDDVAVLQHRLSALGFDAGRIDGILGPATERALKDFQRNSGITVDGVCGPDVLRCLARLGDAAAATAVAGVRERDRLLHAPRQLAEQRIVVGETGGLAALADGTGRALREEGALVAVLHDPDHSAQAAEANRFGAVLYVGVQLGHDDEPSVAFYSTTGFESLGGRRLAELVAEGLGGVLPAGPPPVLGMRSCVLRETRMPAVLCSLGSAEVVVPRLGDIAHQLADAAASWIDAPLAT